MRDNLKHAMRVIDGEDAEARQAVAAQGQAFLEEAKAASHYEAQLKEAIANDPVVQALERVNAAEAMQTEQDEAEAAADMALAATAARDEAWKDAQGAVNRAIVRGGRDPISPLSTDTRALRSVAELLIFVQETKGEASDADMLAAFKRGQAVAKALAGGI